MVETVTNLMAVRSTLIRHANVKPVDAADTLGAAVLGIGAAAGAEVAVIVRQITTTAYDQYGIHLKPNGKNNAIRRILELRKPPSIVAAFM